MSHSEATGGAAGDRRIIGIVLAGGQSRRMGGGDKCLLRLGGKPLLGHVVDRLAPQADWLLLNANGDPARFDAFGLRVIPDSVEGFAGPLAGVLAGLEAAAEAGAEAIVTAAADTPFFPRDLTDRLVEAAGEPGLALAASRDVDGEIRDHPTFGLWPTRLAADLRRALVDEEIRKVVVWTRRHGAGQAVFEAEDGDDPFFNLNRPEDIVEAQARLAVAGPSGVGGPF